MNEELKCINVGNTGYVISVGHQKHVSGSIFAAFSGLVSTFEIDKPVLNLLTTKMVMFLIY